MSDQVDMTNPKDLALAHNAAKRWPKRWTGITDELKQKWCKQLETAIDMAEMQNDPGTMIRGIAVGAVLERQNQDDEERHERNERLDGGLATEKVVFEIAPPRILGEA